VVSSPSSCPPRSGFAHDPRVAPSRPPTQPERLWSGAPPRSRSLDPPQLRKALSCSRSASAHKAPSPSRDSPQHTLTTSRSRSASLSPSPAPFSPPAPPSSTRGKLLEGSVFPPNRGRSLAAVFVFFHSQGGISRVGRGDATRSGEGGEGRLPAVPQRTRLLVTIAEVETRWCGCEGCG